MSAGPPRRSTRSAGAVSSRKSSDDELDAGQGIDGQEVDADDPPPPLGAADALSGKLRPAAGRGAEIDDALAGLEEAVLLVDLQELVGGARAQPSRLARAT